MDSVNRQILEWELTQVIHSFSYSLDNGHYADVLEIFAEDGEWDRAGNLFKGHAAILEALESRPNRVTRHLITNCLFSRVESNKAEATMCVLGFIGKPDMTTLPVSHGMAQPLIVEFDCRFIRVLDDWKIDRLGVRKIMEPK